MNRPLLIVNADDWGRSHAETDAALACLRAQRITSATAMVFMEDSMRAAAIAREEGLQMGLHLNLCERFTGGAAAGQRLRDSHARVVSYLTRNRLTTTLYNPILRADFDYCYQAQRDEFARLYGLEPSHIDGHHHQHLCANMLLGGVIRRGEKVRRSFHFWPEEKGLANRAYRATVNQFLARRYRVTDFFFALSQCLDTSRLERVLALSRRAAVEVMAHPVHAEERSCLMSDEYSDAIASLNTGTYSDLQRLA